MSISALEGHANITSRTRALGFHRSGGPAGYDKGSQSQHKAAVNDPTFYLLI